MGEYRIQVMRPNITASVATLAPARFTRDRNAVVAPALVSHRSRSRGTGSCLHRRTMWCRRHNPSRRTQATRPPCDVLRLPPMRRSTSWNSGANFCVQAQAAGRWEPSADPGEAPRPAAASRSPSTPRAS